MIGLDERILLSPFSEGDGAEGSAKISSIINDWFLLDNESSG